MTAGLSARTHWPGLDGVRGIAAIVVVLFHAQLGFAVNGYVGVDVFFALSGFLITTILLAEIKARRTVRLRRFFVRRFLRLYPALVATCLVVLAAGVAADDLVATGKGVAAALLYVANWWSYTGHPAPLLEHTWTLAIEEHFYLLWPFLLLGLTSRRRWLRTVGVLAAAGLLVAVFAPWPESIRHVQGTYRRGFPIVWGSLLAVLLHSWRHRVPERASSLVGTGALLALLAVLLMPWTLPEPWLTGPGSITGGLSILVLVGVVVAPGSWANAMLGGRVLSWFGARSYGLYLYHFPVLQVLRHHVDIGPEWGRMLVGVALSVVIAWASFRWLEEPFLRLKDRIGRDGRPRDPQPGTGPSLQA